MNCKCNDNITAVYVLLDIKVIKYCLLNSEHLRDKKIKHPNILKDY